MRKKDLPILTRKLARSLRKARKPIVLCVNKIDNENTEPRGEFATLGFERSLSISAEHGRGISEMLDAIAVFAHAVQRSKKAKVENRKCATIGRHPVARMSANRR